MQEPNLETETSTEGGLFFQKDVTWPGGRLETPLNTTPVKFHKGDNFISDSKREIADIYHDVSASSLKGYRAGESTKIIDDIDYKFRDKIDSEVKVVFLEYTETKEIPLEDMRTMVEIQSKFADIIIMPL